MAVASKIVPPDTLRVLVGQMRVDFREKRHTEVVLLQQILAPPDCGLDRRNATAEKDVGEAPHRCDVVQRFIQSRIGQVAPASETVDA